MEKFQIEKSNKVNRNYYFYHLFTDRKFGSYAIAFAISLYVFIKIGQKNYLNLMKFSRMKYLIFGDFNSEMPKCTVILRLIVFSEYFNF